MIKINPKLIEDDKEYSFSLTETGTRKVLDNAIVMTGKDIKEILQYLFWSTSSAINIAKDDDSLYDSLFNHRKKQVPKPSKPKGFTEWGVIKPDNG